MSRGRALAARGARAALALLALAACGRPGRVVRQQDLLSDGRAARPARLLPYHCQDETHRSRYLRGGQALRRRIAVAGDAELVVAACRDDPGGPPRALRLVLVGGDGEREVRVAPLGPGWQEQRFDLRAWRGRDVALRLVVDAPPGEVVFLRDFALRSVRPAPRPRAVPRALLISLDTVREDALGGAAATPVLDRLAGEAERFTPHWAAEISTKPSHASMLTGVPAALHGCDRQATPLAAAFDTVAERLARAGVTTAAFASQPTAFAPRFGLGQGFGEYRSEIWSSAQELRAAADFVGGHRDAPLFVFVHLFEAHSDTRRLPYESPGMTAARVARRFGFPDYGCRGGACASRLLLAMNRDRALAPAPGEPALLRALYEAGVASLDRELGRFFADLRADGLWDDLLVILTADHGEAFGEHGYFLHTTAHEEVLRVPLLVKWPRGRRAGSGARGFSSSLDLAPTILARFGLPAADLAGRDLASEAPAARVLVSRDAVRVGDRKLLLATPEAPAALYDLAADPGERHDLLPGAPAEGERLRAVWASFHAEAKRRLGAVRVAAPGTLTPGEIEHLRALGYLR